MLSEAIQEQLRTATSKALATNGPEGINVVPVSVIGVTAKDIVLYDFFMNKTAQNIVMSPTVALTAWTGLAGIQVKATAVYQTNGDIYEAAVKEMKAQFPERTLKGIIVLTPTAVYDISPGEKAGELLISSGG